VVGSWNIHVFFNLPAKGTIRPRIQSEVDEGKLSKSFPEEFNNKQRQREQLPIDSDAPTFGLVVPARFLQDDATVLFGCKKSNINK
jgi:hypothetical protein